MSEHAGILGSLQYAAGADPPFRAASVGHSVGARLSIGGAARIAITAHSGSRPVWLCR
jgi:hypothetical protein